MYISTHFSAELEMFIKAENTWAIPFFTVRQNAICKSNSSLSPNFIFLCNVVDTKENIKAPRHLPLWGEFTGDRWIPHTQGQ